MYAPLKRALFVLLLFTIFFFSTCRTVIKTIEEKKPEETETLRDLSTEDEPKEGPPAPEEPAHRLHENIMATCFYIGEYSAGPGIFLDNRASAWTGRWVDAFGDIDNPENREGYFPGGFMPLENPFYCALPYNDLTADGYKENLRSVIPWISRDTADPVPEPSVTALAEGVSFETSTIAADSPVEASVDKKEWPYSYCKNRWIRVQHGDSVCYAQWEDVGPFETDDLPYVFGDAPPKNPHNGGAGIDLSPACFSYLGMSGGGLVSWRFVAFRDVPDGPWKTVITTSEPSWE